MGIWPLRHLVVRTPRLTLRLPTWDELEQLAEIAGEGVSPDGFSPFVNQWSNLPPTERMRYTVQSVLGYMAAWTPDMWSMPFGVFYDDAPIGMQILRADNFAVTRQVRTTSWLGRGMQGKGFGKEMRAGVLAFAFDHLEAKWATTAAREGADASIAVSKALGYDEDGMEVRAYGPESGRIVRFRLGIQKWQMGTNYRVPIVVAGLHECMEFFVGGVMLMPLVEPHAPVLDATPVATN